MLPYMCSRVPPLLRVGTGSLLIASVLVNEMLPIMNTKLFGESYKALFISAALVIVFGEIIPQAIFPRYALELGSAMIW